jgi:Flp pilus assembly pilin Flp
MDLVHHLNRIYVALVCRDDTERGASLVEYALLLALIAMVCIASIGIFGGGVGGSLSKSGSRIVSVGG